MSANRHRARTATARKSHYREMSRTTAEEIRRRYFAREANQGELAAAYGMAQSSISRIVSGHVW